LNDLTPIHMFVAVCYVATCWMWYQHGKDVGARTAVTDYLSALKQTVKTSTPTVEDPNSDYWSEG
jgi:hypothetical protein